MAGGGCALALCAGLALLAASPAAAAPREWPGGSKPVATVENLSQGPELVGSRIAWLDSTSECIRGCGPSFDDFTERQRYALRVSRPRGKPQVLYTATSSSGTAGGQADDFGGDVSFGLSRSFLAVGSNAIFDGREDSSFDVDLAGGPRPRSAGSSALRRITRCSFSTGLSGPGSAFALSGPLLVHDSTPCRKRENAAERVTLRDLASGWRRSEQLPSDRAVFSVAAAGRYAAVALATKFDPSGPDLEDVYSIALFSRDRRGPIIDVPLGDRIPSFDVQDDGRVAACTEDGRLSTFSPEEPQPRPLGSCTGDPRIADDRIVFRAGRRSGIQISNLAGKRSTVAPIGSLQSFALDFDGRSVAYDLERCFGGTELLRVPATTRGRGRPYVECPASIRSRGRLTMRSATRTRFSLRCPRGCSGSFDLFGARSVIASGVFERGPGRSTVRALLSRSGRRALARRGSLRVKLKVTVGDRDDRQRRVFRTLRLTR